MADEDRRFEFERALAPRTDDRFAVYLLMIQQRQHSQLTGQEIEIAEAGVIPFLAAHRLDKFVAATRVTMDIVHFPFQRVGAPRPETEIFRFESWLWRHGIGINLNISVHLPGWINSDLLARIVAADTRVHIIIPLMKRTDDISAIHMPIAKLTIAMNALIVQSVEISLIAVQGDIALIYKDSRALAFVQLIGLQNFYPIRHCYHLPLRACW